MGHVESSSRWNEYTEVTEEVVNHVQTLTIRTEKDAFL